MLQDSTSERQVARCEQFPVERHKMEEKHSFRKLNLWQKTYLFVLNIYKQTQEFPSFELYGLTSQIRRGAVSILANIAEGSERQYKKEFVQFLSIARGSLAEVETYLMLSKDLAI